MDDSLKLKTDSANAEVGYFNADNELMIHIGNYAESAIIWLRPDQVKLIIDHLENQLAECR